MSLQSIASATILLLPFTRFDFGENTFEKATTSAGVSVFTHVTTGKVICGHQPTTGLGLGSLSIEPLHDFDVFLPRAYIPERLTLALSKPLLVHGSTSENALQPTMDRGKVRTVHIPNLLQISAQNAGTFQDNLGISIDTYRYHGPRSTHPGKKPKNPWKCRRVTSCHFTFTLSKKCQNFEKIPLPQTIKPPFLISFCCLSSFFKLSAPVLMSVINGTPASMAPRRILKPSVIPLESIES